MPPVVPRSPQAPPRDDSDDDREDIPGFLGVVSRPPHRAFDVTRALDLFVSFNILMFDPDTTLDSVAKNLDFIEYAAEAPFNFGRVELYAGTPLLARMRAEDRCTGDYLQGDYRLGGEPLHAGAVERAVAVAVPATVGRPAACAADVLVNGPQPRHGVERQPPRQASAGVVEGRLVRLRVEAADDLEVEAHPLDGVGERVAAEVAWQEAVEIRAEMFDVAARLEARVGRGHALTFAGDRVATPARAETVSV